MIQGIVTGAKKVEGAICEADGGSYTVRLIRFDDGENPTVFQSSRHGRYPTLRHAQDVGHKTVRWINEAISAYGAVRDDDVQQIHRWVEESIARQYARWGVPESRGDEAPRTGSQGNRGPDAGSSVSAAVLPLAD